LEAYRQMGQEPLIIHLGDHDPSGIDMTRDNRDRLGMFAQHNVEVIRLALNMDQVEQYTPPPNPAKTTDSRAKDYIAAYGTSSWELDALEPRVINELLHTTIRGCIDAEEWEEREQALAVHLTQLEEAREALS
jgi:hypothetical protein